MARSPIARRMGVAALAIGAIVLLWLLLAGGEDSPDPAGDVAPAPPTEPEATPNPVSGADELSSEELVDQVLLVGFDGSGEGSRIVKDVGNRELGGVLILASNWDGKAEGEKLIEAIREAGAEGGPTAPLIATDQEGGPYRALDDLPPAQREIEIGDRGSAEAAEKWARGTAEALAELGIDLNLAPVADVATLDSPIADRAFSDDAAVAAEMTAAAVTACGDTGVACAVSHFPGLGAASQDTADGPATVGLDSATLRTRDLVPFEAAFDAGAPAVVVSHGLYSSFDAVTPASLLPAITTDLLRDEVGFDGLAISDDIGAGAITATSTPAAAAVEAINAGIDLVQVADPGDVQPVRRALLAAVEDGTLSEERLREAAGRVLALKRELAATKAKAKAAKKGRSKDGEKGKASAGDGRGAENRKAPSSLPSRRGADGTRYSTTGF